MARLYHHAVRPDGSADTPGGIGAGRAQLVERVGNSGVAAALGWFRLGQGQDCRVVDAVVALVQTAHELPGGDLRGGLVLRREDTHEDVGGQLLHPRQLHPGALRQGRQFGDDPVRKLRGREGGHDQRAELPQRRLGLDTGIAGADVVQRGGPRQLTIPDLVLEVE